MVRARETRKTRGSSVSDPVVFIAADPRECVPWVAKWSSLMSVSSQSHWMKRGLWRGRTMIAIANGAGAGRAYAAAIQVPRPAQIWNIGFGGAVDPDLRVGDIVVADLVRANGCTFSCERPRVTTQFRSGIVHTIEDVAQTAQEKRDHFRSGASVVEMEAAGVARAASEYRAPFFCVRAISDLAAEDFENNYSAALRPDGRFSAVRLVAGAMLNPRSRFGELIRLQKRTAAAAKNLGEFLAHCEF